MILPHETLPCAIQRSGRMAEPVYQRSQAPATFLTYCRELHCKSSTGFCTPHNSVGPNLPLIDKKFKLGR